MTVRLRDTPTNVAGLAFTNTASFTYNQLKGDATTQQTGRSGTSASMTVVEPVLTLQKSGPPANGRWLWRACSVSTYATRAARAHSRR